MPSGTFHLQTKRPFFSLHRFDVYIYGVILGEFMNDSIPWKNLNQLQGGWIYGSEPGALRFGEANPFPLQNPQVGEWVGEAVGLALSTNIYRMSCKVCYPIYVQYIFSISVF